MRRRRGWTQHLENAGRSEVDIKSNVGRRRRGCGTAQVAVLAGVAGDEAGFRRLVALRAGDAVADDGEGIERRGTAGDRRQPQENDVQRDRIDRQQRHASPQEPTHGPRHPSDAFIA